MDIQLAEKLYYKEEERKAELLNTLNFVLAILGLSLGLFAFYVNTCMSSVLVVGWILLLFLCLDFLSIGVAIFYVIRAFHNHDYQYLESPNKLKEKYDEFLHYSRIMNDGNDENAEKEAKVDFNNSLIENCIQAATENDIVNMRRKKFIHLATRFCIISIVFLAITFIPFVFTKRSDNSLTKITGFKDTLTVKIHGEVKQEQQRRTNMPGLKQSNQSPKPSKDSPQQTPQPTPPPKPLPAGLRLFKESADQPIPKK